MEKELVVGDTKVKYFEKTNENNTVFLFLHGWSSKYNYFYPIYKNLDNVIALDFPGFGGSSKLKNAWNLGDYAKITKEFIDKKIPKENKIIFVAHSFGGRVLVKMLDLYEHNSVKQLIFIGVPFVRKYRINKKIIFLITKFLKIFELFVPKSSVLFLRKKWYKAISTTDYFDLKDEFIKKTFQNVINEDISQYSYLFKKYKTNFIWGENDTEAPLSDIKKFLGEEKQKLFVVKNSGHFPFVSPTEIQFMDVFNKITKI